MQVAFKSFKQAFALQGRKIKHANHLLYLLLFMFGADYTGYTYLAAASPVIDGFIEQGLNLDIRTYDASTT